MRVSGDFLQLLQMNTICSIMFLSRFRTVACRREKLTNLLVNDVIIMKLSIILVQQHQTKTKISRIFKISFRRRLFSYKDRWRLALVECNWRLHWKRDYYKQSEDSKKNCKLYHHRCFWCRKRDCCYTKFKPQVFKPHGIKVTLLDPEMCKSYLLAYKYENVFWYFISQ